MKEPKEYLENAILELDEYDQPWYDDGIYDGRDKAILTAIKQAQIDAYNEAIDDVAENAVVEVVDHEEILSKHIAPYDGEYCILPIYGVDEDSILKLKR